MTTKEYLQQIEVFDSKINQKKAELHDLRLLSTAIGAMNYDADRVQTSPTGDGLLNKVARIVDLESEIDDDVMQLIELKHKVINEIHVLTDVRYIDILFKRYVEIKNFERIAVEMDYNYDYVRELHVLALNAFEVVHQKTYWDIVA